LKTTFEHSQQVIERNTGKITLIDPKKEDAAKVIDKQ
jgi:hypothetical protein